MLFFTFSNAGATSSKWRFLASGDNARALQAKDETCSGCDEGSDVAQMTIGVTAAIAVMNWNIFFMFSTLRLKANFKSKEIFREKFEGFSWRLASLVVSFSSGN
ncbi:MAG: hypothetical protein DMF20_04270 [Verrucomicrobia bacterium]|nr:MAG: hypothetical protein DMF20_04270 [Verrucomicrobiota bacterium]